MDWKDVLSQMATPSGDEPQQAVPTEGHSKRKGVVYSTDPNYAYNTDEDRELETLPMRQQPLRISMERSGRGGKTVTLIRGFVGTRSDLAELATKLKQRLGVGGSAKDGEIIIQGDHRARLTELLRKEGYTQTRG